jgi:transcriptional regulator with XRE-family HTH domain
VANDFIRRLLARIRALREARGLSQEAFAERAGLKYKHYQAIEAGRKPKLQLPTLIKIAKALDLEPWQLLNFEFQPPAVADDQSEHGSKATAAKGAARPAKRRAAP